MSRRSFLGVACGLAVLAVIPLGFASMGLGGEVSSGYYSWTSSAGRAEISVLTSTFMAVAGIASAVLNRPRLAASLFMIGAIVALGSGPFLQFRFVVPVAVVLALAAVLAWLARERPHPAA